MPLVASRDLKRKLLNLFPFKILKAHFDQKGKMGDVVEIISDSPNNVILDFIFQFHGMTKQNIHLFTISRDFNEQTDMNGFPLQIVHETHIGNVHRYIFFPVVTYTVYLNDPVETESMDFLQPAILEIQGRKMTLKFTKLSKNIQSYFPVERSPRLLSSTNAEEIEVANIILHFRGLMLVSHVDFNQGIKHLWENDALDCSKVNYLGGKATVMYAMNGEMTFKEQYPEQYEEMKTDPLGLSVWKALVTADNMLKGFQCNPSAGTFSINRQSDNQNQIDNAIARILAEN